MARVGFMPVRQGVALWFFIAAQLGPSQILNLESHFRSGTLGFGRAAAEWKLHPFVKVHAEAEGATRASVSQAYAHFYGESWNVDVGRQVLSVGDERLVAANRERGLTARGWDGVSAQWKHFRAFAAQRGAERLRGVVASLQVKRSVLLEPYVIECARGLRAVGSARGLDYNIELISEGHGIWAGHWQLGPAAANVEFNYATPHFNELSPGVLNSYGTEDPYPWSDSRNVAVNMARTLKGKLQMSGSYRSYWTASGRYLSQHAVAGATYEAEHWRLDAGLGRMIATRHAETPAWTPYVAMSYRF